VPSARNELLSSEERPDEENSDKWRKVSEKSGFSGRSAISRCCIKKGSPPRASGNEKNRQGNKTVQNEKKS